MQFYVTETLGPRQSVTPEGFLLCSAVPIARTGEMIYGPDETDMLPGPDGRVRILRSPEEVFHPSTIASFMGKPVVDGHTDITPLNWRGMARGVALNIRRGDGVDADLLLADLLIQDAETIEAVQAGKREISCGYDCDYEEVEPGLGTQRNIIGNHIALVERGRCGPRCSIGDHAWCATPPEDDSMRTHDNLMTKAADKVRAAFKARDEGKLEEALKEAKDEAASGSGVHLHLDNGGGSDPMAQRLDALETGFGELKDSLGKVHDTLDKIRKGRDESEEEEKARKKKEEEDAKKGKDAESEAERAKEQEKKKDEAILGSLEMEAPPGTGDKARGAKDSAYLADSFQETLALAEIIAPGVRAPTFDVKTSPITTYDAICDLRRRALQFGYNAPATAALIEEALGGKSFKPGSMTCDAIRPLFMSVAAMKKRDNNRAAVAVAAKPDGKTVVRSISDINKFNRQKYG